MTPAPSSCALCGVDKRDHFQRWARDAGWHAYMEPGQELIKARMLARRAARQRT